MEENTHVSLNKETGNMKRMCKDIYTVCSSDIFNEQHNRKYENTKLSSTSCKFNSTGKHNKRKTKKKKNMQQTPTTRDHKNQT